MRRHFLTILLSAGLLVPLPVFAVRTQSFTFSKNDLNAEWKGFGPVRVERADDGLVLLTENGTGAILTAQPLVRLPQAVSVVTSSAQDVQGYFLWVFDDDPEKINYSMPVPIRAGAGMQTTFVINHENWGEGPKSFGFAVPMGSAVAFHRIDMAHWSLWERFTEAVLSFWTFDSYQPYSINFVWGPQFAFNTVDRNGIYDAQPPQTTSATKAAYIFLITGLLILGAAHLLHTQPWRRRFSGFVRHGAILLLCGWLLFDLRMGLEYLSWVAHDLSTYILKPADTRTLRDRDRFYDFAEYARPLVADRKSYIFYAPQPWPFIGNIRYITYPSLPGNAVETDDTWVVYGRPDILVDTEGRLTSDGQPVSPPGSIIGRFDDASFVFRTSVPPASQKPVLPPKSGTVTQ